MSSAPSISAPVRLPIVDAARGLAIVQMIAYHFCYDLNHFGWIHVAMTRDPDWIAWRTAIVGQFLFLVGVSLVLRGRALAAAGIRGPFGGDFWRRWIQVAISAAMVSLASAWLFGHRWIWFGVLHFVIAAQLLLAPLARRGSVNIVVGGIVLAVGLLVRIPEFSPDGLSWIGFSPVKPQTEDFVPLFPWLGVVLFGMGVAGLRPFREGAFARLLQQEPGALRTAAWLGRWPLTVYMLHQPLLYCALYAVQSLR